MWEYILCIYRDVSCVVSMGCTYLDIILSLCRSDSCDGHFCAECVLHSKELKIYRLIL